MYIGINAFRRVRARVGYFRARVLGLTWHMRVDLRRRVGSIPEKGRSQDATVAHVPKHPTVEPRVPHFWGHFLSFGDKEACLGLGLP